VRHERDMPSYEDLFNIFGKALDEIEEHRSRGYMRNKTPNLGKLEFDDEKKNKIEESQEQQTNFSSPGLNFLSGLKCFIKLWFYPP